MRMDDPLKPKTVPLAAETILWFEFLLDPELITKHLQKAKPGANFLFYRFVFVNLYPRIVLFVEPSALDLLLQFISMTPDNVVTPQPLTIGMPQPLPSTPPQPTPPPQPAILPQSSVIPSPTNSESMIPIAIVQPTITIPNSTATGITTSNNPNDGLRLSQKQLALKILALKVGTHLKWNLDILEKQLPLPKQLFLLRDLCTISFGKKVCIPLPMDFEAKISK